MLIARRKTVASRSSDGNAEKSFAFRTYIVVSKIMSAAPMLIVMRMSMRKLGSGTTSMMTTMITAAGTPKIPSCWRLFIDVLFLVVAQLSCERQRSDSIAGNTES